MIDTIKKPVVFFSWVSANSTLRIIVNDDFVILANMCIYHSMKDLTFWISQSV